MFSWKGLGTYETVRTCTGKFNCEQMVTNVGISLLAYVLRAVRVVQKMAQSTSFIFFPSFTRLPETIA